MKFLPAIITTLLLVGVYIETAAHPSPRDAAPFHAVAARMIGSIPYRIGDWEGVDVTVPRAAQALLRPNALLSRVFRNQRTGYEATMNVIQCRDTRDMAGHYPPVCYPANGWEMVQEPDTSEFRLLAQSVPIGRFCFRQRSFDERRELVIRSFFVLPGVGVVVDMQSVRNAAADYRARPFGAAQIQVVVDGSMPASAQEEATAELLKELHPIVEHLAALPGGGVISKGEIVP